MSQIRAGVLPAATEELLLVAALRQFQTRAGLEPTGELDRATIDALNTPGSRLVPLLAVNLERWRWLPADLGDRHIWVNIPEFELEVRSREARAWLVQRSMPVVVGSPGRWRTPVFSDTVSQIVFNPTWTIPASIQRESYGRVDPRGMVRQPGPSNPLGRVKFVFPNPYGIYLHDTNHRDLMAKDRRDLSSGCIRVGNAEGLARELLRDQPHWPQQRIDEVLAGRQTIRVPLRHRVPVRFAYQTAWVDGQDTVHFREDIYDVDARRVVDVATLYRPTRPAVTMVAPAQAALGERPAVGVSPPAP